MNVHEAMRTKMNRALKFMENYYDLDDIENALHQGKMQGHVVGNTWGITQINDYPQKRTVSILYVIGDMVEIAALEKMIEDWSRGIGASMITTVGRDGWVDIARDLGWRRVGTLYAKDL